MRLHSEINNNNNNQPPLPQQQVPAPHQNNWNQFEVQYLDLVTALRYMLVHEIPRKTKISEKEFDALQSWTRLLKRFGPGAAPLRRLFYRLDEWVQAQTHAKFVMATDWLRKLDEIQVIVFVFVF